MKQLIIFFGVLFTLRLQATKDSTARFIRASVDISAISNPAFSHHPANEPTSPSLGAAESNYSVVYEQKPGNNRRMGWNAGATVLFGKSRKLNFMARIDITRTSGVFVRTETGRTLDSASTHYDTKSVSDITIDRTMINYHVGLHYSFTDNFWVQLSGAFQRAIDYHELWLETYTSTFYAHQPPPNNVLTTTDGHIRIVKNYTGVKGLIRLAVGYQFKVHDQTFQAIASWQYFPDYSLNCLGVGLGYQFL